MRPLPPNPPVTEELLREITERIVRIANPERIILFGSHARGTARPDSDIDLLIVEEEDFGPERSVTDEYLRISLALMGIRVPMDLVLVGPNEFHRWRDSYCHVIRDALHQGKVLFERAA